MAVVKKEIWNFVDRDDVGCVTDHLDAQGEWRTWRDAEGRTLLHRACEAGSLFVAEALVRQNALLNSPSENAHAETALHSLLRAGPDTMTPVVRLLILAGAELNARDASGRTPLHWAVSRGAEGWVSHLIAEGADPLLKDASGCNSIDLAKQSGKSGLLPIFRSI
ncbi:MAG: ankyrin repeat domain-containing protein [Bdellovibrionaceae bacterium]|nr:ankyrin repeat domain-containing protein [Pseudobdellovibrionaceae bacterium]